MSLLISEPAAGPERRGILWPTSSARFCVDAVDLLGDRRRRSGAAGRGERARLCVDVLLGGLPGRHIGERHVGRAAEAEQPIEGREDEE